MRLRLTALTLASAAIFAATAQPRLEWLETVHDFGAFHEDLGRVECSFKAVNTGSEPVTVINARANCGCTRPTYQREPVQPGDTLSVSVAYDATGRPGKFDKQIRVETTAGRKDLLIKGTVIGSPSTLALRYPVEAGNARLSNSMTPFGQAIKGRVLAAAINIYNPTDHTMRPAVDSLPPYINALFRPETIPPGEQATLSLTAYTDRCPDYGVVTGRFLVIPDSENAPERKAEIATTIIVNEDFSKLTEEEKAKAPVATLSTEMVDFGVIDADGKNVTREFTITNTGHKPLIIRRIFTVDPSLSLRLNHEKIAPGKKATVKVTVDTKSLRAPNPLNARITVIANSPSATTQTVRVVGEVR